MDKLFPRFGKNPILGSDGAVAIYYVLSRVAFRLQCFEKFCPIFGWGMKQCVCYIGTEPSFNEMVFLSFSDLMSLIFLS